MLFLKWCCTYSKICVVSQWLTTARPASVALINDIVHWNLISLVRAMLSDYILMPATDLSARPFCLFILFYWRVVGCVIIVTVRKWYVCAIGVALFSTVRSESFRCCQMSNAPRSPVGGWFNKRTNRLHRRFANNGKKRYDPSWFGLLSGI